ncbi:hypothetical protein B0A49_07067 [Cryomyces minteri]|uniref:Mediator of RNA polymerase II transcription subunit 19 n=1 Tax=Cryomyces minteri TaxID=331657 RepID=A0A4U0X3I4_9PEZI|nr:hypothetical protein B0A49_07067 [Cryomyces minteri]
MTTTYNLPTPVSSAADTHATCIKDGDNDTHMRDGSATNLGEDFMMGGADEHRRSDHDREAAAPLPGRAQLLDRLKGGVGSLFKLCENRCLIAHPISRPHPSQNVISLYGLDQLAGTVARRDPITGDKINKLRKSYEGKIKPLGLAGRNKPVPMKGELIDILGWPDEEWYAQKVHGKDIGKGQTEALEAKLDRAVRMAPGRLPPEESNKWKNVLGLDEGVLAKPIQALTKKTTQQPGQEVGQAQPVTRVAATASPRTEPTRPARQGTKRRYDESSYQGYAEGYNDDNDRSSPMNGEDTMRPNAAKKKRRKVGCC